MTGPNASPASSIFDVDQAESAARIAHDIQTLSVPPYTDASVNGICRYAYTPEFREATVYLQREFEALDYHVSFDPVGSLVARNRPLGQAVFGLGSHFDSVRGGGRYDGTLGVVTALEVCRLNRELGLGVPLQVIGFLEEEGSGFGQMLLGSRIMAGLVTDDQLRTIKSLDDGRSFWAHAEEAGYEPARWRESAAVLDDVTGWIEMHIEQGRVLEESGRRFGVVEAIAGYVHSDVTVHGRADHAGATPMALRYDAGVVAAEVILELERRALASAKSIVGTVGEIACRPNVINIIPEELRLSLDIRGLDQRECLRATSDIAEFARAAAEARGMSSSYTERGRSPTTFMDPGLVAALESAASELGQSHMRMHSGAAHDTMCLAGQIPSAMLFVQCVDGVSHSPLEEASPSDASAAAHIMLWAMHSLMSKQALDSV